MKTVAIIGCGKAIEGKEGWAIGWAHADGYLNSGHDVVLYGVDISHENLLAFGQHFNIPPDRLFSSEDALYSTLIPDCVSICTWPALHLPMCKRAMDHGVKVIVCEKPLTLNVSELRELEAKVANSQTIFVVGHQRTMNPATRALRDIIRQGVLGEHIQFRFSVGDGWDVLSMTTHWFDMANYCFEKSPEWVLAGMDITNARRYQQAIENVSVVYAHYGNFRDAIFISGPQTSSGLIIQGEKGFARVEKDHIECATWEGVKKVPILLAKVSDSALLLKDALDALDEGNEPICSLRRSGMATEMAYAAQESARTHRKISLPMDVGYAPIEVIQHPPCSALVGRKLLLYADDHFGSGGREGIAQAFSEISEGEVSIVRAEERGLIKSDIQGMDAILIYHTQKKVDEETRSILSEWVAASKPVLIIHCGLGAWPEWEDYQSWCGWIWEWGISDHPHEESKLQVAASSCIDFGWRTAWLPKDEVFTKLKRTASTRSALSVEISTGQNPGAWIHANHPHIGVWVPGHSGDLWRLPVMREGAARILQYCLSPLLIK